ncbi:MAG: hypothetical protein WA581_18030 [Candidatus Acidiferrales bacterium]
MPTALIGLFDTYGQAEAAVRDLELVGIVGEEVEMVSDVDRDLRAETFGMQPHESIRERVQRALRALRSGGRRETHDGEVHDDTGEMPNYIGEQEFYATHVKKEGAILVVRPPSQTLAARAEAILKDHGSKTRDGKNGVLTVDEDDRPRQRGAGSAA